jgi:hypothetical protein
MHDHGGRRTPARPPRRRRRLHLAGLVGALALTLAVAACGGGGKSNGVASLSGANKPTATTSASGSSDPRQAMLNFARCMRQHGINMPDPKPGGGIEIKGGPGGVNPDSPTFKAAQQACQQYEPKGSKKQEQSSGGGK